MSMMNKLPILRKVRTRVKRLMRNGPLRKRLRNLIKPTKARKKPKKKKRKKKK